MNNEWDDFFDNADQATTETKGKYLFQPHAAQVISIFRMLSCGDSKEPIMNNLVQIGTGEGKSLTLAMTYTVLALLGYSIDCVCTAPIFQLVIMRISKIFQLFKCFGGH